MYKNSSLGQQEIFTKQQRIDELKAIRDKGFIRGTHQGNSGNPGNTLEVLLGVPENNLPIAQRC